MPLRQINHNSSEYRQMLKLRQEILPYYWRLPLSKDDMEKEKNDTLIAAFDENKMLGCCILSANGPGKAILRDMAVVGKLQGMGVGASLLNYAENLALAKGFTILNLHCPDMALPFYEKAGYQPCGNKFVEAGVFLHPLEKILK